MTSCYFHPCGCVDHAAGEAYRKAGWSYASAWADWKHVRDNPQLRLERLAYLQDVINRKEAL